MECLVKIKGRSETVTPPGNSREKEKTGRPSEQKKNHSSQIEKRKTVE